MAELVLAFRSPAAFQSTFTDAWTPSTSHLRCPCLQAAQAPWRKEHAVEVTGQSYYETGIGHMAR